MVNSKFWKKNVKYKKLENFKNPQCSFVRTTGRKLQTGLKTFVISAICRSNSVLKFSLPLAPMLTKMKKNRWNLNFQNFRYPKHSFVRTTGKKSQEKFENFQLWFVGVALNYHLRVPNFTLFCSNIARFPDNWGFFLFLYRLQWWSNLKFSKKNH